jgi:hypothetical protein
VAAEIRAEPPVRHLRPLSRDTTDRIADNRPRRALLAIPNRHRHDVVVLAWLHIDRQFQYPALHVEPHYIPFLNA